MAIDAVGERVGITMPCEIETRRETTERRAAWHKDCPRPETCACPAHQRDSDRPQERPSD
jgi:hypothetical protein